MTETLANGYSSDSSQRGLSYEYPDDLVRIIFIIFCILVHLTKEATALEGLMETYYIDTRNGLCQKDVYMNHTVLASRYNNG